MVLVLIFAGMPVGFALATAGAISFYAFTGRVATIPYVAFDTVNSFTLTAVPLFVLMGQLLIAGGLSKRLFRGASRLVTWIPGGLLHASMVASALFAAVSGSGPASTATIGSIALPELEKRSYDMKLAMGGEAAGGALGILIPPSINLIVYG